MTLIVDGLGCVRGGREVFRDIGFSLAAGNMLAVTGPNGAGKSSLLRILAGLLAPAAGSISLTPADDGAAVHYFGHLDGLKDAMSLRENLLFWSRLYGGSAGRCEEDAGAISDAADRFGLAHALDLPVGVFSAGQRRRAGLARMIVSPRPLWLLDEPTSALDSEGETSLGALISQHLSAGGMIVAATHLKLPVAADLTLAMRPEMEPE